MAHHQERSRVWRYFTRTEGLKARCHLCLALMSFKGGSISNLHLHLKRKHAEHLDDQNGAIIRNSLPDPTKDIENNDFFKNEENTRKLIELIRERGNILYSFSKENRWNSDTHDKLWQEIADDLGNQVTHTECRQCWRSLRYLYNLHRKDPKFQPCKYANELSFLESLYPPKQTEKQSTPKEKKNRVSPPDNPNNTVDELIVEEQEQEENLNYLDENSQISQILQTEDLIEETENKTHKESEKNNSLSFYKNFDEMDDLDFFLGFLNKKMRTLTAEEKSYVEMKFTQMVFEAESGLL